MCAGSAEFDERDAVNANEGDSAVHLASAALGAAATSPPLESPRDWTPRIATEELLRELESANQQLEAASAEEVITWAAGRFGQKLTMGTAFGPEGMVILHMLSSIAPVTPVFNLDTGYQFPETLAMQQRVRERSASKSLSSDPN